MGPIFIYYLLNTIGNLFESARTRTQLRTASGM